MIHAANIDAAFSFSASLPQRKVKNGNRKQLTELFRAIQTTLTAKQPWVFQAVTAGS
jgi:hypothetical protein